MLIIWMNLCLFLEQLFSSIIRPIYGPFQGLFLFLGKYNTMLILEATVNLFQILFTLATASPVLFTLPGAQLFGILFPLSFACHTLPHDFTIQGPVGGPVEELDNLTGDVFLQVETVQQFSN